ncbi:MAG: hypothetical protein AAGM38_11055 [Pseudomonadota bacterium]
MSETTSAPPPALDAAQIVKTLEALERRIKDRFPKRGLARACGELTMVARATAARVDRARRPNYALRAAGLGVIIAAALGAVWIAWLIGAESGAPLGSWLAPLAAAEPAELLQGFESTVNLAILAALAIWFLVSLEERSARRLVLRHLHELRSLAHVVDMHQLTKDPVSILNPGLRMPSSPERDLSPGELSRYLDYCVEMLSLIGKLAALYAEHTQDAQIIDASNDIEDLTTNLSRKIWQKIMMIGPDMGRAAAPGGRLAGGGV